ncbi:kinase-like domain-containing protein [Fomes fomentarius]|nr:kinase-like domain-containing protein [Fomes fomentarius]
MPSATAASNSTPHRFDPDYFPARINATLLSGRYKILRKLGEGVSSSSWLVQDEQHEPYYKYLAVKILTIDASSRHDAGQTRELEFLKMIAARNDTDYLPMLRDSFVEQGPKGKHLCLVQDLYSTSVSALRRSSPHKALPAYIARNIVAMLVDALAQLHEMRIVHTDVKMDNLLFGNSLYSSDDDLRHYLESSPPKVEGDVNLDGQTYPLVKSQPIPHRYTWDTSAFEAETMTIYLTDLGHAQRAGEQPTTDCFGAFALRAPETIIGSDFGPGVDIWAVGCITFELLVGRWLFQPEEGEDWTAEDDHLAKMMELTGQSFPESMLHRAKRRKDFFDDAGNLRRVSELIPVPLETAMANYKVPGLAEDEIKKAADFIRACLRFDYKERATAEELKGHTFLADAFRC